MPDSKLKEQIKKHATEFYNKLDEVMNLPEPIDNFATVNLIPFIADCLENMVKELLKDADSKSSEVK